MPSTFSYNSSSSPLNFGFSSNENSTNLMPNYKLIDPKNNGAIKSIFGNTKFIPFPTGVDQGKGNPKKGVKGYPGYVDASYDYKPGTGDATGGLGQNRNRMHNDDVYNISIGEIIDYTNRTGYKSMKLTAAHFAYLKDVGVYPNNRLMVARRFASPVGNDLTAVTSEPLASLISWLPNDGEYLDISFGEHWDQAAGSFEDVLNSIGKDTTLSADNAAGNSELGKQFYQGFNIIPFPGLMEGLQRDVMSKLGIIDDKDPTILPQGNPNLIKNAMQRRVVQKGQAGSGLKCKFSIKMKVEYEQKYINGLDNTLSYFDLIANVLSFATSDSQFMYNKIYAGGATGILSKLISGDISAVISSITDFIHAFTDALLEQAKKIATQIKDATTGTSKTKGSQTDSGLQDIMKKTVGAVVGKYKMAILGIISSLTGQPSTPWHITIGNPKRPVFSSGDMLMEEVQLKLGSVLAWNDLPSTISVEFTLTNARPIGAQEILNRLNTGKGRSYVRIMPDFASSNSSNDTNNDTNDFNYSQQLPVQNTDFGPAGVSQTPPPQNGGDSTNILPGNGTTTPLI
jgi:hypothetical protein